MPAPDTSDNTANTTGLTLLIPGLVWPAQALADMTQGLPLPALSRLLGSGQLRRRDGMSLSSALARQLGVPKLKPGAALRRKALGLDTSTQTADRWLCLDPIHLGFVERRLLVDNPEELKLTQEEATQLAASLADCFAALGDIEVARPQQWHLRLAPNATPPDTEALADMLGRRADRLLSALPDPWRQALNNAQIELHAHPVNQAREATGRPTVNSLWPWGAQPPDVPRPPSGAPSTSRVLLADSLELGAMAIHCGLTAQPLPASYASGLVSSLAVLDTLTLPARRADANRWREALLHLETHWFAPILADLSNGRLRHLRIDFVDVQQSWSLTCTRRDLWFDRIAFWRKPASIHRLASAVIPSATARRALFARPPCCAVGSSAPTLEQ